MSEQWTSWRDHDGKGVPVAVGKIVEVKFDDNRPNYVGVVSGKVDCTSGWLWENRKYVAVFIRYRIRKPKALQQLIEMVETLPVEQQEFVKC